MSETQRHCLTCGRAVMYQKRWAANWNTLKYCSQRCRKEKPNKQDKAIEFAILQAIQQQKSITDEQIALTTQDISNKQERVRRAARRLEHAGELVIWQKGKRVNASFAKGAFDLRRAK